MPFQPNQNLYGIGISSTDGQGPQYPHYDVRAPTSSDVNYALGTPWVWAGNGQWTLNNLTSANNILTATWLQLASGTGDIVAINGTANQITASTTSGTTTLSLPSAITTPGSLTTTTTLASGTTFTAGTGITATTGNIVATAGNITTTAGSITSATTLTATSGAITATNGNLVLGTAGNKLSIATGSNASVGVTCDISGSPGAVSVSSTAVTTSSIILYSRATTGGTPGQVSITSQTTGAFTLTSTGNETSTFNYLIIN